MPCFLRSYLTDCAKDLKADFVGPYADALGRNISKAVNGQLSSQQALDEAAEEWVKIVQKLGIDSQKRQYSNFLKGARKLGYKV